MPGYWAAVLVLATFPGLPQLSWPFGHDWWAYWGFIQTYSHRWIFGAVGQVWTVCIEIPFYLLLPLYVVLAERGCRRWGFIVGTRIELVALGSLALLSLAFRVFVTTPLDQRILLYTLPAFFAWFAIGMALAVISVEVEQRSQPPLWLRAVRRHAWLCWVLAAALLVWVAEWFDIPIGFALLLPFSHRQVFAEFVLEAGIGTLVVLPGIFADDCRGLPQRILGSPGLTSLGIISYGVYLWHSAILGKLFAPGAADWLPKNRSVGLAVPGAALSLLAGWLSYRIVERPFLVRKQDGQHKQMVVTEIDHGMRTDARG